MPAVSIIIPVFNTERYLSECLASAVSQTLDDIEVIVVDDGSTDGSPAICDEFALSDSRVTVIHKRNEGQGIARNVGIDVSKGDYITFLDSDDMILPSFCEILWRTARKDGADFVECGYSTIDGIRKVNYLYHPEGKRYEGSSELLDEYLRGGAITTGPCASLYHRKLFSDLRFSSLRSREDIDLLYKVFARVGKAAYIPDCLYVQHIRMGSVERSGFNEGKLETVRILEELRSFISEVHPELEQAMLLKEVSELNFILGEMPLSLLRERPALAQDVVGKLETAICELANEGIEVCEEKSIAITDWRRYLRNRRRASVGQEIKDAVRRIVQKTASPDFFIYERTVSL